MDANKVTNGWLFGFVELLYYGFVAASVSIFVRYLANFFGGLTLTVLHFAVFFVVVMRIVTLLTHVWLVGFFLGVVTN